MKTKLTGIEKTGRVLLAVLAGLLIWSSAINNENFQVDASLPVQVSVNDSYRVLSVSADSVTVRYSGSGWDLLTVQLGGMPDGAMVSFDGRPGSQFPSVVEFPLANAVPDIPGAVVTQGVTPSLITCTIDTCITRRIPVAPVFTDGIPDRYRLSVPYPSYVTISGPASYISQYDSVATEPLPGGTSSYLASLAPGGDMVAYSGDSVRVSVFVPAVPLPLDAVRFGGALTP